MNPDRPLLRDATFEVADRIALLTLNRDDVRNALTGTHLIDDIIHAVTWAAQAPLVSVLVLTGGGSAFCSGGNIKELAARTGIFAGSAEEIQQQYRQVIQRLPLTLQQTDLPLIAAINGPAIGAGFDLANMCDLRLASTRAKFGETFINLGLVPGDGGAWWLQRLVGEQRAAELTLTGRHLSAAEALALGLLLEVTTPEQLLPRALALAAQIAAKSPPATRQTKHLLRLARHQSLAEHLDLCAAIQGRLHHTAEHQQAIKDFLANRPDRRNKPSFLP